MTLFSPSRYTRLNEAVGFLLLLLGLAAVLSLLSFSPADPSWNTVAGATHTHNLLGLFGARWSDLLLQAFGISAFLLPLHIWGLGWKWLRSSSIESPWFRIFGSLSLWLCVSAAFGLMPAVFLIGGSVRPSGIAGMVIADYLTSHYGLTGAAIMTAAFGIIALYFASTFEVSTLMRWVSGPVARWQAFVERWKASRKAKRQAALAQAKAKAAERSARRATAAVPSERPAKRTRQTAAAAENGSFERSGERAGSTASAPPFDADSAAQNVAAEDQSEDEIPIRTLEYTPLPTEQFAREVEEARAGSRSRRRNHGIAARRSECSIACPRPSFSMKFRPATAMTASN